MTIDLPFVYEKKNARKINVSAAVADGTSRRLFLETCYGPEGLLTGEPFRNAQILARVIGFLFVSTYRGYGFDLKYVCRVFGLENERLSGWELGYKITQT